MKPFPKGEETIFAEALGLPVEERAAYVAQATADNPKLRQELESLLQSYAAGDFMETAAAPELRPAPQITLPVTEKPGETIGRYKLLQQIGEGGCGVVYMAEQLEPVRRRVALKIIKLGMDTKSVIARFEAERQALALMDHPNIAKVLDAGATETGRPYFVMELVRGMKITEYCDEEKLSTRERLNLLLQACHAIQHAHQKGIIHRDIKPSNILVSVDDGIPMLKVIDFGIAKATSGLRLTDRTLFTAFDQFIGTPAYMSPEQAMLTNVDVDTRSDIYALGVLLYELLTGKTPFDPPQLLGIGLDEMRRMIREQEPVRPSTRLSTLPGQELSTMAHCRGVHAPKLVTELRGDLDWIVMKALEKDRARRYETANGLAMDIQRYLSNEPVEARPPSKLYRFGKTVRRNKAAFSSSVAVALALVIGVFASTWQANRAGRAEQRVKAERDSVNTVLQFFQEKILAAGRPEGQDGGLGKDVTLREAIDAAEPQITKIFRDRPLVEAAIRHTLGESYHYLGEPALAIQQKERALELRRQHLGSEHPDTVDSMDSLGFEYVELEVGKLEQGLALLENALEVRRRKLGPEHSDTLKTMAHLIRAYSLTRNLGEAVLVGEQAVKLGKNLLGFEHRTTEEAMNNLSVAYMHSGKLDAAIALIEDTLETCKSKLSSDHPRTLMIMHNLARAYAEAGQWKRALPLFEEAFKLKTRKLGPEHPQTLVTMQWLATGYRETGNTDQALTLLQELLKLKNATLGPNHRDTVLIQNAINETYRKAGKLDQLEAIYRQQLTKPNCDVLAAEFELGLLLLEAAQDNPGSTAFGDSAREGEQLLRNYLTNARSRYTNAPLALAWNLSKVAELRYRQGNFCEGETLYRELIQKWRAAWGTDNLYVLATTADLARLLTDWAWAEHTNALSVTKEDQNLIPFARACEAEALLRQVLAARLRYGTNSWRIGDVKSRLGAALVSVAVTDPAIKSESREVKLCEAESLLLEGGQQLEKVSADTKCNRDAFQRIIRLHEAWNKPHKRAEWQRELVIRDQRQVRSKNLEPRKHQGN